MTDHQSDKWFITSADKYDVGTAVGGCGDVSRVYVTLKPNVPVEKYDEVLEKIKLKCQTSLDACAIPQKIEIVKTLKTKPSMKIDKQYYMDLAQSEYERVHQSIAKDMTAKILETNKYNYLNIERDYNKVIYNYIN